MNEAQADDTTALYNFAKDISGYIKSLDQNHLVSFGTMGSGQPGYSEYVNIHTLTTIDVLEYHDYNAETTAMPSSLSTDLADAQSLNKPLFIGESGIDLSDFSADQRAVYFSNKMNAYFQNGGSIYIIWDYHDDDGADSSYDFNASDPLVQVIKNQVSALSTATAVVPTVAAASTSAPAQTISITGLPTPTPAPQAKALGGLNLIGYCESLNSGGAVLNNTTWDCTTNNTPINMTAACQWSYPNESAEAVQDTSNNPYSWDCYQTTSVLTPLPTPVPTTVPAAMPTSVQTTSATAAPSQTKTSTPANLGGLDLIGYCSSINSGGAQVVNNTWECTANNSVINMTSACQWKYPGDNAQAVQNTQADPYSWSCYEETTASPTPAPQAKALGGLNLIGYCESLNSGGAVLNNTTWDCTTNNTPINMTAACQWSYPNESAEAVQDTSNNPYSWDCYDE
jgi:hypothetical protein